jgi:hypothetical protein
MMGPGLYAESVSSTPRQRYMKIHKVWQLENKTNILTYQLI